MMPNRDKNVNYFVNCVSERFLPDRSNGSIGNLILVFILQLFMLNKSFTSRYLYFPTNKFDLYAVVYEWFYMFKERELMHSICEFNVRNCRWLSGFENGKILCALRPWFLPIITSADVFFLFINIRLDGVFFLLM